MVDWSSVLQHVLEYVLPILAVAIVGYIVALVKSLLPQVRAWLVAKAGAEQVALAEQVIAGLVKAAEQQGFWDAALAEGQNKKAWVLERAQAELAEHGIKLDVKRLDALVEAAVLDEFNFGKIYEARAEKPEPRVIGAG